MGRRKKEPEGTHRENIAAAAEQLFAQSGIAAATMDDIAKAAKYSKATLYVYFTNKDKIVGFLVLKRMKLLYCCIEEAVLEPGTAKDKYNRICMALAKYQEKYPFYFSFSLGEINVDFEKEGVIQVENVFFMLFLIAVGGQYGIQGRQTAAVTALYLC